MPLTRRRFVAQTAAATLFGPPMALHSRGLLAGQGESAKSPVRKVHLDDGPAFGVRAPILREV